MKPDLERIKEIFSQVMQKKSPAERERFLADTCQGDLELRQQVESLLRAQEQAGEFLAQTVQLPPANFVAEKPGDKIGRYKLLQQIGAGGCGVVYMADQEEPVKRRVALKVIKPGMDTREVLCRFEAERQALALMDHPNIAKVLDAGATETGRPFFVMELVRGIPITRYCDENKLNTEQRLELFIKVCQAIQHAHQKGIIHRDIKPSNILVADHDGVPVPKVIDFGIAKATSGQTLTDKTVFTALEQFIGTPAYMSPEQAKMSGLDIDTRSDIYSLGVLLYELLTGKTPFDAKKLFEAGFDEIRRIIREEEPPRPSQKLSTLTAEEQTTTARSRQTDSPRLLHLVSGDLDWIVMKCLEKDRNRRYETANGLASDLERHINNEPVLARPPSNMYRFQKLVRRNKLVFAAGTAVAAAVLVGLAVSTYLFIQERRAEHEQSQLRIEAESESKKAEIESKKAKSEAKRAEAAEQEQSQLRQEAEAARQNEARLRQQAETDEKKAKSEAERATQAEALAKKRLTESEAISKFLTDVSEHPDMIEAMINVTISYNEAGRPGAIELQEEMLKLCRNVFGPEHTNTFTAMRDLANYYDEAGRRDEALKLREEVLALRRKMSGPENPDTLKAMEYLAISYDKADRRDEALKLGEEVLAMRRKVLGPEHPATLTSMYNLAYFYDETGRRDEAIKLREELLALSRKVNGPERSDTLNAMHNLADSYCSVGRNGEGIALLEKACELDPKDKVASLTLATWQTWFGHDTDYEATRRRLVQQAEGTDPAAAARRAARAYCLRPSTDAALLAKTLNLAQQAVKLGEGHPWLPLDQLALGMAEYRNGQYTAAERTLTNAEQTVGRYRDNQETVRVFLAMSLFRQHQPEEARKRFRQAEAKMPPLPKDERKPLVDGKMASYDVLICWLAYKEAKSLLNEPAAAKP